MARRPRKDQKNAVEAPDEGERFLARWSRRKREANEQTRLAKVAPELDAPPPEVPQASENSPAVAKTDADMPPLESLDENSDYKGFMSPGVSEQLRRAALRKLFHSTKFNIVDGLDDYAEDYTTFGHLGDIITAHQRHQREVEEERMRQRQAQEEMPLAQQEGDKARPAAGEETSEDAPEKKPSTPVAHAQEVPSDRTSKKADGDA